MGRIEWDKRSRAEQSEISGLESSSFSQMIHLFKVDDDNINNGNDDDYTDASN